MFILPRPWIGLLLAGYQAVYRAPNTKNGSTELWEKHFAMLAKHRSTAIGSGFC